VGKGGGITLPFIFSSGQLLIKKRTGQSEGMKKKRKEEKGKRKAHSTHLIGYPVVAAGGKK